MFLIDSFRPGKRATAADQGTAMDYQPEPKQGSAEPKQTRQQVTRAMSTRSRAASNTKSVDDTRENVSLDHVDEGEEVYASRHTAARQSLQHSRYAPQRSASARIPGWPEQVERNAVGPNPSSQSRGQESLDPRAPGRPEQPEQGPIVLKSSSRLESHQASSYLQEPESPRWHQLPDKIDGLSANMRAVQSAIRELQQDKHEKVTLRNELKEAQAKLQETTTALEDVRKRWKKAASELDKLQSQRTGLYQLTDSDLIESAKQLRYDIRAFSAQYFAGKAPGRSGDLLDDEFWEYMVQTTPGSDDYQVYLRSETGRPVVIQSFLWRLLVGEVFEKFLWVPRRYPPIAPVYQALKPCADYNEYDREIQTAPEAERRFQMWKATTSDLILEHMKDVIEEDIQTSTEKFNCDLSKRVLNLISSFVRNSDEGILDGLIHIIESSIALDQNICKQGARVDWEFPPSQAAVPFEPACMAIEPGAVAPQPGKHVSVVTAPALKKRGKSTGENFGIESLLLKMDVAYVPLSLRADSMDGRAFW